MSGGHFDYAQYRIADIYNEIEDCLDGHELDDCDVEEYIRDHYLEDDDAEYVRENRHTIPNWYGLDEKTVEQFRLGIYYLKKAEIYAQRIDWLLSGDDGEESFHKRLKAELQVLDNRNQSTTKK